MAASDRMAPKHIVLQRTRTPRGSVCGLRQVYPACIKWRRLQTMLVTINQS